MGMERKLSGINGTYFYKSFRTIILIVPFQKPLCLDSLDASLINNCRNPVIACQTSTMDNDSSNMTEIVLFDKYLPQTDVSDIVGYYNLQASGSNYFKRADIATTTHAEFQPDITFSPYDNNFLCHFIVIPQAKNFH